MSNEGAAAPTIALSLFALVGAGGIAFDYARMASLDTELQSAADQATLAAASQLDGSTGACQRAALAARAFLSNETRLSNDGRGLAITVPEESSCDAVGKVRFYQDKAKTTAADADSNANFVEVEVDARDINFALTPVVGALSNDGMIAIAFAGVNTAVCKTPPIMLCNPLEDEGLAFNADSRRGDGLRLVVNDGGGMVPGNFGFLRTGLSDGSTASGTNELKKALGWDNPPGNCQPGSGVHSETGAKEAVMSAINSRFDILTNGQLNVIDCNSAGGKCSSSVNSHKDLVMDKNGANLSCGPSSGGSKGWKLSNNPYRPVTDASSAKYVDNYTDTPDAMGHPRDRCHAISNLGNCDFVVDPVAGTTLAQSHLGDGDWDIDTYWRVNHGAASYPTSLTPTIVSVSKQSLPAGQTFPTRYMVYLWEIETRASASFNTTTHQATVGIPAARLKATGLPPVDASTYGSAVCNPTGMVPGYDAATGEWTLDRRRVTVAVVNCNAYNGGAGLTGSKPNIPVAEWMDVFLVEPSYARGSGPGAFTEYGDLYVEIIRGVEAGGDNEAEVQLVVKNVPYLIE
ncbi:pilus assembly protein TadG-related protein [Sphingomicrobium arenosum]|uniref:pilus assembly protein TadG-related protein n=1 Tax=Sphingomicrobium arenosum TaxID=2233861 RepID=UPI002240FBD7|nr:pilus assembly protein TadG-related protein [Sphingomicrobium arenosum]